MAKSRLVDAATLSRICQLDKGRTTQHEIGQSVGSDPREPVRLLGGLAAQNETVIRCYTDIPHDQA